MYAFGISWAGATFPWRLRSRNSLTGFDMSWKRRHGETDIALQRVNWLRSMGLIERKDEEYRLTDAGIQFVSEAVGAWADTAWTPDTIPEGMTAGVHETTVCARAVDHPDLLLDHCVTPTSVASITPTPFDRSRSVCWLTVSAAAARCEMCTAC